MSTDRFSPEEFGAAYRRFMEWITEGYARERSPFKTLLEEHFATDPGTFPVTGMQVAQYDLPTLQLGVEAYLEQPGIEELGFVSDVPELMRRIDVLLLPSLNEGSALVT